MWQLTMLFSWLPGWFWSAILLLGIVCMAAAWFLGKLPFISTYRFSIQLAGIIATVVSIWFLGAASNEEKWQEKLKIAEAEKLEIEAAAKKANEDLNNKLSAALNQIEDARKVNNTQANALANALKDGKATVTTIKETVVQNMTAEEKANYDKLNAEQKAAYDKKISDLLEQYKQCPNIPAFNIEEIDKKIRPPRRTEEKK